MKVNADVHRLPRVTTIIADGVALIGVRSPAEVHRLLATRVTGQLRQYGAVR